MNGGKGRPRCFKRPHGALRGLKSESFPNFDGLDLLEMSGQFSCKYLSLRADIF